MALPTLCDCSLRTSVAEPLAELLLVAEEPPTGLATLSPELLVDEDASLTEEEFRSDEDELLTAELERRLLSCELLDEVADEFRDEPVPAVIVLIDAAVIGAGRRSGGRARH